ncbi:MAG TPA: hypothetical protein VK140_11055 [Ktedonobacteraceae bacterium]|nr:hypothetical protein [Ktedonobacteraceae bacterium]
MSKTKIRCNTCGKWFQSANAKEVTCPDCTQKARKEKMAAKSGPLPTSKTTGQTTPGAEGQARSVPPPPKPKLATGGTSHWLDSQGDVKVGQPDQPARPKLPSSPTPRDNRGGQERGGYPSGPGNYRDRDERSPSGNREGNRGPGGYRETDYRSPGGPGGYRESNYRSPAPYRVGGGMGIPDTVEQRPRQPMVGPNRGPRPVVPGEPRPERLRQGGKPAGQKTITPKPKPDMPPKPKREKIPPPAPFTPTEEQIKQVEARYAELAVPTEFDGIRTQIATELSIPKTAVKKIVKEYRERQHIPSWWELQTYKGNEEEMAKIKAAYEPHLPLPAVGIHKQIAEELSLQPGDVYQAIKAIRLEMNLPQYNDPALHGLTLRSSKKKEETEATEGAESKEAGEGETQEPQAEQEEKKEPQAEQEPKEPQAEPEEKKEPQSELEKEEPEGKVSSIETDASLHRVGDTIEIEETPTTETTG